jgi:translation elongation factor P/translation initiation factor 5A
MGVLEELQKLPSEELEKILTKFLKENKEKSIAVSKALGKALREDIKDEKLKTEAALAQSKVYTLTRDVEEVALLTDAVKNVLGEDFYNKKPIKPEEEGEDFYYEPTEQVEQLASEFGVDAGLLQRDLLKLLTPYPPTTAMDWVAKMLRNQTVKIEREKEDEESSVEVKEYQIGTVKSEAKVKNAKGEVEEKITDYKFGILIGKGKKAKFVKLFSVAVREKAGNSEEVWLGGYNLEKMSIEEIRDLLRKVDGEELVIVDEEEWKDLNLSEEDIKQMQIELVNKVLDKYVFFRKTVASSKLNEEFRRLLKQAGFFTARKNQSVFIADKEWSEELYFSQVRYFRTIVKAIKKVFEETKRIFKQDMNEKKVFEDFPSLSKQTSLSKAILIEEVSVLSQEEIVEELKERFKIGVEQLEKYVKGDKSLKEIKNQDWFREMEIIKRKIDIPQEWIDRYEKAVRALEEKENYVAIMKAISWEKYPITGGLRKALSIYSVSKYKPEGIKENLRQALKEVLDYALSKGTAKKIKEAGSILIDYSKEIGEILGGDKQIIEDFLREIVSMNPSFAKQIAKTYQISEDAYRPKRKFSRRLF